MASIKVKQISSLCKTCMRVTVSVYKNTPISVCIYIQTHTAFCVFIPYGIELRIRVVKTFEHRQQSADDCLHIFIHENMQLPWVSYTHALTFPLVLVTHILPFLLSRMFPCCKSWRNISSSSCHWAPWQEP